MKKFLIIITLIFSFSLNSIAQESETYYEKIIGSGTANGGEYSYEAVLMAKMYKSGGSIVVKVGIKEYKITSFFYKGDKVDHYDEFSFPIIIKNIQSDLTEGSFSIKNRYSGEGFIIYQKYNLKGVRKGGLDNVELNSENKTYYKKSNLKLEKLVLDLTGGELNNTYFEELAKIASSYDSLKQKEKKDKYLAEQKAKAQEKLKEIEIAQERDRKAREREALKSENYYKTSPNSIKTGGYPLTGYQKAQQDINRVNASYDKFEKAISDFKNKSYQRYKESQKEYPTIEEQIAELDKVTAEKNRRMEETSLFFNLQSSLSDLEENISDASLENLKGIDTGNIYLKMVQLSRKKGYPTISDYTRKENSYGFKTNNPPIYNVYHTSIAVIPISLINNHPYLYNLYLSEIRAKKMTDEFYNFDVKFIKFKDVSILNKYWNLIFENYDTDPLLDFKLDNTKFPMQSFESYVAQNLHREKKYKAKLAAKKDESAKMKSVLKEIQNEYYVIKSNSNDFVMYLSPNGTSYKISKIGNISSLKNHYDNYIESFSNLRSDASIYIKLTKSLSFKTIGNYFRPSAVASATRLKPNFLYNFNYDLFTDENLVAKLADKEFDYKTFENKTFYDDLRSIDENNKLNPILFVEIGNWKVNSSNQISHKTVKKIGVFPCEQSTLEYSKKVKAFYCSRIKSPPFKIVGTDDSYGNQVSKNYSFHIFKKTESKLVWIKQFFSTKENNIFQVNNSDFLQGEIISLNGKLSKLEEDKLKRVELLLDASSQNTISQENDIIFDFIK